MEAHWSSLKIILNNKKIHIIPPLYHKNDFLNDFEKKVLLFNSFFADQCSQISNSCELPRKLEYLTESRFSSIIFTDDVAKMIQNLDPNKAHDHGQISIRMLKFCITSVFKTLEIISNWCLKTDTFPNAWKKAMLLPSSKRPINNFSKTTVRSRYFLCVVKYLWN